MTTHKWLNTHATSIYSECITKMSVNINQNIETFQTNIQFHPVIVGGGHPWDPGSPIGGEEHH